MVFGQIFNHVLIIFTLFNDGIDFPSGNIRYDVDGGTVSATALAVL
jgi:hypothetical protein